jgi:hypothetical protein
VAVDRALWWYVEWPWILLWVVTLVAFGMVVVRAVQWLRWVEPEPGVPGRLFYVDGRQMIDLSKTGEFSPETIRRIERLFEVTEDGKLRISGGGGDVLAVIGEVLAYLRKAHSLVDVDLTKGIITPDRSWRRTKPRRFSEIRDYVSIYGRFELVEKTDEVVVLRAHEGKHRVRVKCDRASLRAAVPSSARFNARCVSGIQWDEELDEFVMVPMVVFQ